MAKLRFAAAWVAIDIQWTPEAPVMKWGFVIVTLYTVPLGALLYAVSCREPLPGTHEAFVAVKWRQVVGSTMHCVAGDGIGILAAATVMAALKLPMGLDLIAEYVAGFLFGWTIFQALLGPVRETDPHRHGATRPASLVSRRASARCNHVSWAGACQGTIYPLWRV